MTYELWDVSGNEVVLNNTEDKNWWIKYGTAGETDFLAFCQAKGILLGLADNPARESGKKYLPEFVQGDHTVDLKGQGTPFFKSTDYGVPARYAVTLNVRDVEDVRTKYKDCDIVFWVKWVAVKIQFFWTDKKTGQEKKSVPKAVDPLHGVWRIKPADMFNLVEEAEKMGRCHSYQKRPADGANAPESYVLDVRDMENLWLETGVNPLS